MIYLYHINIKNFESENFNYAMGHTFSYVLHLQYNKGPNLAINYNIQTGITFLISIT